MLEPYTENRVTAMFVLGSRETERASVRAGLPATQTQSTQPVVGAALLL